MLPTAQSVTRPTSVGPKRDKLQGSAREYIGDMTHERAYFADQLLAAYRFRDDRGISEVNGENVTETHIHM